MKKVATILTTLGLINAGELAVTGNDAMQYSTKTLTATVGEPVKLSFKHIGQLPKTAMGHNIAILKPGSDMTTFATASMSAAATDYIPADEANQAMLVANTKMIGGGEEDAIEVTFTEAGEYPFLCTFPGHYAIMNGVITVK